MTPDELTKPNIVTREEVIAARNRICYCLPGTNGWHLLKAEHDALKEAWDAEAEIRLARTLLKRRGIHFFWDEGVCVIRQYSGGVWQTLQLFRVVFLANNLLEEASQEDNLGHVR